jgi:hypothetical protein
VHAALHFTLLLHAVATSCRTQPVVLTTHNEEENCWNHMCKCKKHAVQQVKASQAGLYSRRETTEARVAKI